jgi:hypothetical protein
MKKKMIEIQMKMKYEKTVLLTENIENFEFSLPKLKAKN